MVSIQKRNPEMIDLLRSDFQAKYEPNFAWKSACSLFQSLSSLRGFWPMSGFDSGGDANDLGGLGHHLVYNGNPTYNYSNLIPYIDLDGTGDYLSFADHADYDIIGNETYIANPGVTIGGWWYFDTLASAGEVDLLFKINAVANGSYGIYKANGNTYLNGIAISGAAATYVSGTLQIVQDEWFFGVFRFIPSTEVKLWLNEDTANNVAAIPATLDNSTAPLTVGSIGTGGNYLDGYASLCFVCACALSDIQVETLFEQTRAMFGA